MTQITNSTSSSPSADVFHDLSLEGQLASIVQDLEESGRDARSESLAATEQRFDRAHEALELRHRENRLKFGASLFAALGQIGGGIGGMVSAFGASGSDSSNKTGARVAATADLGGRAAGGIGSILSARASDAGTEADAAQLAAERLRGRSETFGDRAQADRAARDTLMRQLEAVIRERQQGDETAARGAR